MESLIKACRTILGWAMLLVFVLCAIPATCAALVVFGVLVVWLGAAACLIEEA